MHTALSPRESPRTLRIWGWEGGGMADGIGWVSSLASSFTDLEPWKPPSPLWAPVSSSATWGQQLTACCSGGCCEDSRQ